MLAALASLCRPSPVAADPAAEVFSYWASDGEFAYRIEVRADRRWSRSEHSGWQLRSGRLSRRAMKRFRTLLARAPFDREPGAARSATTGQRQDADGHWVTCGDEVDAATQMLPYCLGLLADGQDDDFATACAR